MDQNKFFKQTAVITPSGIIHRSPVSNYNLYSCKKNVPHKLINSSLNNNSRKTNQSIHFLKPPLTSTTEVRGFALEIQIACTNINYNIQSLKDIYHKSQHRQNQYKANSLQF